MSALSPDNPFRPLSWYSKCWTSAGTHSFLRDEVKNDPWVNLAGPCPHGQAVERRETHRAFDAAPALHRAHGGAAAEMRDDHFFQSDLRRHIPQTARDIFV